MTLSPVSILSVLLLSQLVLALSSQPVVTDTTHCAAAAQFLRSEQRMVTQIERDTIDDWRTKQRVVGCRVTAAGGSDVGVQPEAVRLYDRLRAAHWVRTPDPYDSPNEASLRFRLGQSDCLFNVNREALLGTDAESAVNEKLVLRPGETRYQVFVMCMPARPAASR